MEAQVHRIGSLKHTLLSFSHLYAAFQRAFRGTKNHESMAFAVRVEEHLFVLQQQLADETYRPMPYRYFTVHEPKKRIISVAHFRDRVVHHALVGVLEPIYERRFIFDSYATRRGKGVRRAILRAQRGLRAHRYFLKMDIRSYFPSIDHLTLESFLARTIKDDFVLRLCQRIIACGGDGRVGLPIGNLTSQFFANVYLNAFDHWIKERLRLPHYVRYMDDFVLFGDEKPFLRELRDRIGAYLAQQCALQVKEEVTRIQSFLHGLSFLGVRVFPHTIRYERKTFMRSYRKLQQAVRGLEQHDQDHDEEQRAICTIQSVTAHLRAWGGQLLAHRLHHEP
jgi:hypothetical protein